MRLAPTALAFFLVAPLFANDGDTVLLADVADHAMQQSQITRPGSKPFHLKATIAETGSPDSDYKATVEEYWVSPTKWRRTVSSPDFSQKLVVNEESVSEENTGDYYPVWLNHFITAIFDPLPMLETLRRAGVRTSKRQLGAGKTSCTDMPMRVDRWILCFTGKEGLLSSVFTKGYGAEFKDFKAFGNKQVPRLIEDTPEPGTTIDAVIDELTELEQIDETLFVVEHSTQPKDRIQSVHIDQDTFMKLALTSTEITWPPQGGGPATGGCAVYVGTDRAGNVRESWPGGCDSTGIQDVLREAVKTWKLRPPVSNGVPVQLEALLGFTFHTTVHDNPPPLLTDAEIRQLATNTVEPNFSDDPQGAPAGTEVTVQISVDETGKLAGVGNTHNLPDPLFFVVYAAITQWQFRPYMKDQKPQYIHADVTFHVPEPLAVVQNGKYGFIDHYGNFVIKPQFIWADDFWQGLGTVYACGQYVSIDLAGNLLPLRIAAKGHLEPEQRDNKFGFVDSEGQFKISPVFDHALPFSGGLAAVKVGEKWGFVDATGNQVIPPKFDAAYYFRDGVALAELDSSEVLIDTAGKPVASGYRIVDLVTDGRVPASRGDKEGYLDPHGDIAIPFLYESVRSFSGGLAAAKQNGKWGYLDRSGSIIIPFQFDNAGPFAGGLAPAKGGSNTGFIDKSGKFSFLLPYDYAPGFFTSDKDGLFLAESDVSRFWTDDGKFGYVNKTGKVVWGPIEGGPDHPPILGWSDAEKSRSCEGITETVRQKILTFTKN